MQAKISRVADRSTGTPFDTENTATNLEYAITSVYADEGYAAAKAHAERSGDPINGADAVDIAYRVTVDEGRLYKLGTIRLPADSLVAQAEVDKMISGQAGGVRGPTIRGVWALISSRYHSKGYIDFAMTQHPEFNEAAGVVDYSVDINPGPVYHMALLKFDNVSDELRKLLMRNWQMFPGDPFDESYVSGFIAKAQTSDPVLMRTLAGVKVSYNVQADPMSHDVNLIIRMERVH
jgi:outer membrane protein assembly factor BamA